jgi:hypothetical protein
MEPPQGLVLGVGLLAFAVGAGMATITRLRLVATGEAVGAGESVA